MRCDVRAGRVQIPPPRPLFTRRIWAFHAETGTDPASGIAFRNAHPRASPQSLHARRPRRARAARECNGEDADRLVASAVDAVIAALRLHAQRLSQRVAEKEVREQVLRQLPASVRLEPSLRSRQISAFRTGISNEGAVRTLLLDDPRSREAKRRSFP